MNILVIISRMHVALAALVCAAAAWGQSDEGIARHIPWSGYWFPMAKRELLEPLRKYDALTGSNAYAWEYRRNPPGQPIPEWHGYCHGWAAASVLEYEPRQQRLAPYGNSSLLLQVSDQKSMELPGVRLPRRIPAASVVEESVPRPA